jgi:hypothetical protein
MPPNWEMRTTLLSRARVRRSQGGAVLVETAIISMLLLTICFGIIEYGMFLRQSNDVAGAIRSGARMAAASGAETDSDYMILQAMKDSDDGLSGKIDKVLVFKANGPSGEPTPTCAAFQPQPGQCSVYEGSDFNAGEAALAARSASQGGWNPTSRNPGEDHIGVRALADYSLITGFFGQLQAIDDNAIVRLEAEAPIGEGRLEMGWNIGSPVDPGPGTPLQNTQPSNGSGGFNGGGGGVY